MNFRNLKHLFFDLFEKAIFSNKNICNETSLGILVCMLLNIAQVTLKIMSTNFVKILITTINTSNFQSNFESCCKIQILGIFINYAKSAVFSYVAESIEFNLHQKFLLLTMQQKYPEFIKKDLGMVVEEIKNKVSVYKNMIDIIFVRLFTLVICLVFVIRRFNRMDSIIISASLLFYPIIHVYLYLKFLSKALKPHLDYINEKKKNSSKVYDKLSNFDIIKSYGLEKSESDKLFNDMKSQTNLFFKYKCETEKANLVKSLLCQVPEIAVLIFSYTANMSPYVDSIANCLISLAVINSFLNDLLPSISSLVLSINELFSGEEQIKNDSNLRDRIEFKKSIEFRNVNLYHEAKLVLKCVNAKIYPSESIAIVGYSGSGKSTFVKSLFGFSKYTGDILVDGADIKDYTHRSMHKLISYISQNDYTSDDTIFNNLILGNKKITGEEVIAKARLFDVHTTFLSLKNGYNTVAGANGNLLNSGLKQKISLIRAVIKDSPVFVLDEATTTMDKAYEERIVKNLLENFKNKTLLMIIHDRKYLEHFDRIFFVNDGRLECSGAYKDLILENENFKKFAIQN